jgi:gamma-glutamyltranspeptidase / glutathione hydrolase
MNPIPKRFLTALFLTFLPCLLSAEPAKGDRGMVATVHEIATDAGVAEMKRGGNAIDAAVACALTLGVVNGHNSGIGGGCFMLIRLANGSLVAIDGRETAPAAAKSDMYLRGGKADAKLSQVGPLAAAVPGALAAYDYAIKQHGKSSLKDHLLRAAKIADEGFQIDPGYASVLASEARDLGQFESSREIFLNGQGQPWKVGETLKQPDLANTYRAIAEQGIAWFYRGPFAHRVDKWMPDQGGLLRAADFESYQIKLREPIQTTYRGYEIIGFPPPSSGGVHVAQILNILESFDLQSKGANSADFVHLVAEAMKLAFADRAYWLGDPDFVPVPRGLISKAYAGTLARKIRMDRASSVPAHGSPEQAQENIFGKHTTHFSTVDAEGNWVACTATINTSFGSKVVVPGTGVLLNNEMDDFSAQPGATNAFGLVGAEANAIAPGKRPLSSMSPTFVLKSGQPLLAVGAAGGPTIISQTLLAIIHTVDFSNEIDVALAQPRFHHQWNPDELKVERKIGDDVLRELKARGHNVVPVQSLGAAQAVGTDPNKSAFVGSADPRGRGQALGW